MKKYHCYSAPFDEKTEELFKEAVFLGQGNNGVVYSLPEDKVIKLFVEEKVCLDESKALAKGNGSKYFPKVYELGKLYIVREKVDGLQLDKYIKKYGLNKDLVYNIYKLTKEFKKLGFSKIDTRCKDIMVGERNNVKIIDPKKCFSRHVDFPRHLMKGLMKLEVLDEFFIFMYQIDIKVGKEWRYKFDKYWAKEKLKSKYKRNNEEDFL
ncbi:serine/threonine protein kinase [Clostridium sp. HBUAS56017]|uniref:serine/threonine protein kinase n=1 Tax=Clostridium sp. HBUAS56017 TaxID=2571128 RepID=UPI001177E1F6|nr:serine/threonine protein kinase [Clostridium sp. HBUAS56017]